MRCVRFFVFFAEGFWALLAAFQMFSTGAEDAPRKTGDDVSSSSAESSDSKSAAF